MTVSIYSLVKRNHLPIISVLGFISCIYILSDKRTTVDQQFTVESRQYDGEVGTIRRQKDLAKFVLENTETKSVKNIASPLGESPDTVNDENDYKAPVNTVDVERPVETVQVAPETIPVVDPGPGPGSGPVQNQGLVGNNAVSYADPSRVEYPGFEMCARVEFQPEHTMPIIAFAVYLSSGDITVRQRLQAATGIFTGSYTWDKGDADTPMAKSGVFAGSTVDYSLGTTLFVKTQIADPQHIATFKEGSLLIVRNPHTMLISQYIQIQKNKYPSLQGTAEEIAAWFNQPDWKEFFESELNNWKTFITNWVTYSEKLFIWSYENFFAQPVQETTEIIKFLHVNQDDSRISCSIQSYPTDPISNSATSDPYTDEMRQKIETYMKEVNNTIITRGQRPLPSWRNTF